MTIQPGQTYRSADPRDSIRIRIKSYTPGENRALVVDATTGKRPRPMLVTALHDSPTTQAGKPRRSGYVLEQTTATVRDAARQASGQAAALPCNWAHSRVGHEPHNWEPQPGMKPVHCPGYSEPDAEHVHKIGNADEDGGLLDDWDNCRDPECPGPTAAEMARARQASGQQPDTDDCECQPVRQQDDHTQPAEYMHEATCPAAGLSDTQPTVDRAAVLREAADHFEQTAGDMTRFRGSQIATELRRMADEETNR